jgi:hypothetical protein
VVQQPLEHERQHLVGAVAHEDVFRRHAVEAGDGLPEDIGAGVGIEAQGLARGHADGFQRPRRGRVGILVGVQLDQVLDLRLLAGDIGGQGTDDGAPETVHDSARQVMKNSNLTTKARRT